MDSNDLLPAGILVRGTPADIAREFASIALLQPVAMVPEGVVCAPRAAPELASEGLRACALPVRAVAEPPGWPEPPSLTVDRWYLRSPGHLPAPDGFDELIQVRGEGFGAWPHPTTLLCLAAIATLPEGPATDLGCGSGLLSQAWARTRGPVTAVDIDARAIAHAQASLECAGLAARVQLRRGAIGRLLTAAAAPVVLANLPPVVHREVVAALPPGARTLVISGVRANAAGPTLALYARLGYRISAAASGGGWGCWTLEHD